MKKYLPALGGIAVVGALAFAILSPTVSESTTPDSTKVTVKEYLFKKVTIAERSGVRLILTEKTGGRYPVSVCTQARISGEPNPWGDVVCHDHAIDGQYLQRGYITRMASIHWEEAGHAFSIETDFAPAESAVRAVQSLQKSL